MTAISAHRRGTRIAALGRLDARMLVGLLLVALSVVGGLAFWGATRDTVPVLVAARDLPAGHAIARDDVSVAQVKLEPGQASLAVPAADLDHVMGRVVGTPVYTGELLVRPRLTSGPVLGPEDAAVTIPARTDSIYAQLRPGDTVTVLATRDKGKPTSQTNALLERATVYAVAAEASGASISSSSQSGSEDASRHVSNITLIVPKADTERLAHAAVNWDLTIALLSPIVKAP